VTGASQVCVVDGLVAASQKLSATVAPVDARQVTARLCDPAMEHVSQLPVVHE
jgi:hypothetical protein